MAPRKRPAPTEIQSNELKLLADHRLPTLSSAAEASNQNAVNSHGTMKNRSAMSMFQEQLQHQQHEQQTIVKTHTMSSAAMTSTSTSASTSSSHSMQSKRALLMKHWQDELIDFSTQITRQAHFTLSRIANHFRVNGMKFDADFRNHFAYISNNR